MGKLDSLERETRAMWAKINKPGEKLTQKRLGRYESPTPFTDPLREQFWQHLRKEGFDDCITEIKHSRNVKLTV